MQPFINPRRFPGPIRPRHFLAIVVVLAICFVAVLVERYMGPLWEINGSVDPRHETAAWTRATNRYLWSRSLSSRDGQLMLGAERAGRRTPNDPLPLRHGPRFDRAGQLPCTP
jgi:hypothetical protein